MSYRPEEQALVPHLDKILEGITGLRKAVIERTKSGDWESDHISHMDLLSYSLLTYEIQILEIKSETW